MTENEQYDRLSRAITWMQNEVHQLAISKGWYERGDRNPLEMLALVVSEIGEAVEAFRKLETSSKIPPFSQAEEELADIIIRLLDMAGHLNLDIAEAIIAKHEYNKSREYRHGGKVY